MRDRVLKGLVPAAFVAVMTSYLFPFGVLAGVHRFSDSGLLAFFGGFVVFVWAPLDPFFETFSLPLIAAFAGLIYQRRPGWIGSLAPLICAVVGLTCLGSAYFWEKSEPLAYGYFTAEASFVIAAVASAVRLILLRRNRALWDARAEARLEPAASASQELLSRYR